MTKQASGQSRCAWSISASISRAARTSVKPRRLRAAILSGSMMGQPFLWGGSAW